MINLSNISILSYSHQPKFLGDDCFAYALEKSFSVDGFINNFTNTSGVSGTFSGLNELVNFAKSGYDAIYLNNVYVGSGYITNLNVESSNFVMGGKFSADVYCVDQGNLYNMTGDMFSGLSNFTGSPYLYIADNFSESLSLEFGEDGMYSFDHSVDFDINPAIGQSASSHMAKTIASGIMGSKVPFAIFPNGGYIFSGKKAYVESYDLINKKYSFAERAERRSVSGVSDYTFNYTTTYSPEGICAVSETAEARGLNDSRYDNALVKINEIKNNAYQRCEAVRLSLGLGKVLGSGYVSQGASVNRFNGVISINSSFSDDPFMSGLYDYEVSYNASENNDAITASAQLSVNGHGKPNSTEKINNALLGYSTLSPTLSPYISDAYLGLLTSSSRCNKGALTLHLLSEEFTIQKYNGIIEYTLEKTDRNIADDQNGVLYETRDVSVEYPQPIYTDYNIGTNLQRQIHDQQTQLKTTISKKRKYGKNYVLNNFPEDMVEEGGTIVVEKSISINPISNEATFSVGHIL